MQKIVTKLVKIMKDCNYIAKNGENDFHHYSYVTTVKVTITLVDGASGETTTIVSLGSEPDNGDKAVMKAQTATVQS